jgi:hypothetical protein
MKGLSGLVDGEHYFETFAEDAIFESRYTFPGWPEMIRGRANLMASFTGYGDNIELHSGDALLFPLCSNSLSCHHMPDLSFHAYNRQWRASLMNICRANKKNPSY